MADNKDFEKDNKLIYLSFSARGKAEGTAAHGKAGAGADASAEAGAEAGAATDTDAGTDAGEGKDEVPWWEKEPTVYEKIMSTDGFWMKSPIHQKIFNIKGDRKTGDVRIMYYGLPAYDLMFDETEHAGFSIQRLDEMITVDHADLSFYMYRTGKPTALEPEDGEDQPTALEPEDGEDQPTALEPEDGEDVTEDASTEIDTAVNESAGAEEGASAEAGAGVDAGGYIVKIPRFGELGEYEVSDEWRYRSFVAFAKDEIYLKTEGLDYTDVPLVYFPHAAIDGGSLGDPYFVERELQEFDSIPDDAMVTEVWDGAAERFTPEYEELSAELKRRGEEEGWIDIQYQHGSGDTVIFSHHQDGVIHGEGNKHMRKKDFLLSRGMGSDNERMLWDFMQRCRLMDYDKVPMGVMYNQYRFNEHANGGRDVPTVEEVLTMKAEAENRK